MSGPMCLYHSTYVVINWQKVSKHVNQKPDIYVSTILNESVQSEDRVAMLD